VKSWLPLFEASKIGMQAKIWARFGLVAMREGRTDRSDDGDDLKSPETGRGTNGRGPLREECRICTTQRKARFARAEPQPRTEERSPDVKELGRRIKFRNARRLQPPRIMAVL